MGDVVVKERLRGVMITWCVKSCSILPRDSSISLSSFYVHSYSTGAFAVWGLCFASFDCSIAAVRKKVRLTMRALAGSPSPASHSDLRFLIYILVSITTGGSVECYPIRRLHRWSSGDKSGAQGRGQECSDWWFGPCHDRGGFNCDHEGRREEEGEEKKGEGDSRGRGRGKK